MFERGSQKQQDILFKLAVRLSSESGGGVLGETLDLLLSSTEARAAAAFAASDVLEPVADRGLGDSLSDPQRIRRTLTSVAERARVTRRPITLRDIRADRDGVDDSTELLAVGLTTLYACPICHRRAVLGVLVLAFDSPLRLSDSLVKLVNTLCHMLATALDSERRAEAESAQRHELEEARQMASLGLLTASVAHELRAPTSALVLQVEDLRRQLKQLALLSHDTDPALAATVAEVDELAGDMAKATEHLRMTVDQLSDVSRRDSAPEDLDLSAVTESALSLARPHLERRGVTLVEQLGPDCLTTGRRDNLTQVVVNLVINAADACRGMQGTPEVTVSTSTEGDRVVLTVQDNGPGIPTGAVRTIFRPFFTTKKRGEGAGLGLKICRDVVTAHGGHIEVVNAATGGARFRVILPALPAGSGVHAVAPELEIKTQRAAPPPCCVLVVDDDPIFARTMRRALRPHRVESYASVSEAEIRLLTGEPVPDLILCDIQLPGKNGHLLHEQIAQKKPDLAARFVFVTGGALSKQEADYLKRCDCPTFFKPVPASDITSLLERGQVRNPVRTLRSERAASQRPTRRAP